MELPKVASVEEFQGGERKVIIISTVRSGHQGKIDEWLLKRLGFLYQPKRFNVVITRARALMIVIGNPHVLCRNENWRKLLEYALELEAYTGCNLPIHLDKQLRQNKEGSSQGNPNDVSNAMEPEGESVNMGNGIDHHEYDREF